MPTHFCIKYNNITREKKTDSNNNNHYGQNGFIIHGNFGILELFNNKGISERIANP